MVVTTDKAIRLDEVSEAVRRVLALVMFDCSCCFEGKSLEIETNAEVRFVACDSCECLLTGRGVHGSGMTMLEVMVGSITICFD